MNKKNIRKSLAPYTFLLVFIIGCLIVFKLFDNSVKELTYYGFSIIHVTKQDRRIFKLIRPDEIFEFSESDSLIVLPQYYSDYLKEHYDSSAERSIIAYCEMVAHRKIEMDKDVNIVTLFNNEDIQKILEINGLM